MRRMALIMLAGCVLSCTDVGLYAAGSGGASAPDRADFDALSCVPLAGGTAFPVKVLFAFQGGAGFDPAVRGQMIEALQSLGARFSTPYISFGLVGFHTVATGFQASFVDAAKLNADAVPKLAAYANEAGPISLRSPLKLARSIFSGDMQTGCRGSVARTRYLLVHVFTDKDTSCANPAFNAGIDAACNKFLPDEAACSACELNKVTSDLKDLADQYGAGEVVVQPLYVRTVADTVTAAQAAAIARSGGTQVVQTDPANLKNALHNLNYASLQRDLVLKRFITFNRSALSRAGKLLADSDGDGVSDEDEEAEATDPVSPDTDLDGLMDGIERKMGLDPLSPNVINACNPLLDTDGDRLNDCEERVLGTDGCIMDTDGDGLPELVELLGGTNPLVPEDVGDADGDGTNNVGEIEAHSDPVSADLAYQEDRGYRTYIRDAEATPDGRPCYRAQVYNVGLVKTRERPNAPFPNIPAGTNDVYIYMMVGRENDPRGTGIGSLFVQQIQLVTPTKRKPSGLIFVKPDEFVLGEQ